jgi:predicted nucleic acid-binding protein
MKRAVIRVLSPASNYIEEVFRLLESAGSAGGNLVSDAQIAALAMAHNATVHTADHDFSRFAGLKCHFPLDA